MTTRCLKWNFIELDKCSFVAEESHDYTRMVSSRGQDSSSIEPEPRKDARIVFPSNTKSEQNSIQ